MQVYWLVILGDNCHCFSVVRFSVSGNSDWSTDGCSASQGSMPNFSSTTVSPLFSLIYISATSASLSKLRIALANSFTQHSSLSHLPEGTVPSIRSAGHRILHFTFHFLYWFTIYFLRMNAVIFERIERQRGERHAVGPKRQLRLTVDCQIAENTAYATRGVSLEIQFEFAVGELLSIISLDSMC